MLGVFLVGVLLIALGIVVYAIGAFGIARFTSTRQRLHALTLAEALGLGGIALGAGLLSQDGGMALRFVLVWLAIWLGGAVAAQMIAASALSPQRPEPGA
ncbi:MAG: monovalent cation/H(+) antiporter subunit G [Geminicoccaceae bacterium]